MITEQVSTAGSRTLEPILPAANARLERVLASLRLELADTDFLRDEPMSRHTSFRIGGPADVMLLPRTIGDLERSVSVVRAEGLPLTVIGNGSNLLVRDGGLRGIVLKVAENLSTVRIEGRHASAQSGALLAGVSRSAALRGLGGLEFAVGIPGTIGGGVMMNAGAYGGEMKDVVTSVSVVDETGALRILPAAELKFHYRTSILQSQPWIVAGIEMELGADDHERVLARMSYNQYLRESKQPLSFPSAGSVFKRPPGRFVGPMVEELGLKGHRIGGAQVSDKHAGFIINRGGARAVDVLNLIQHVRTQVQDRFGVWLETEIRIIGEDADPV